MAKRSLYITCADLRHRCQLTYNLLKVVSGGSVALNKLIILSVLQLGMTSAVLYMLLDTDSELSVQERERTSIDRAESVHDLRPVASTQTVDIELIREIIRSELFEFSAQLSSSATGQEADASDIDPLQRDVQLSEARNRMATYLAVGEISDREIDDFQREISTLDVATQKAMLSELFREINAGNVNVRY